MIVDTLGVYCICTFYVAFFSATIDDRNLIFGHKLHIGTPYRGKRLWTHQIPTSCLPTLLIFIHIEHICSFFVAFFSATIDGRNPIFCHKLHIGTPYHGKRFWTHQIPTSCFADLVGFYAHWTYMRGYNKWALTHSSSCWNWRHTKMYTIMYELSPFIIVVYNCLCHV